MALFFTSLFPQAFGGLFLLLVCAILCAYRRQAHLCYWTLAWCSFLLWQILSDLSAPRQPFEFWPASLKAYVHGCALVCAAWHAGWWLIGVVALARDRAHRAESNGGERPDLLVPFEIRNVLRGNAAYLLVAVAGALLLDQWASAAMCKTVTAFLFFAVYAGSALLFAAMQRWSSRGQPWLLALLLSFLALEQLYQAIFSTMLDSEAGAKGTAATLSVLVVFLQLLTALTMIVLFLGEEQGDLHDALSRLAESQDHFRLVFEHSGVGMALLSAEGHFQKVNPALVQMLGYDADELAGRRLIDLAHPDDISDRACRTELGLHVPSRLYERENRYLHKDGRTVWARVLRVPLRDSTNRLSHLVAVILDITEKRQAEEALAASEERYRLRFQGAFDGIHSGTETGELCDANPAFCRMLGYTPVEIPRLTWTDIAVDREAFEKHLAKVRAQGRDRFETCLRRKDGSIVEVEMSSASIHVHGRSLVHGTSRDIGKRKRAEEALRHAEETLRLERDFIAQVLETAEALIVVLDSSGQIVRFNGKCTTVSGYSEDDVRGRVFWDFLVPERARDLVRESYARVKNERIPLGFESPLAPFGHEERLIAWRFTVAQDDSGLLSYVVGAGLDITEQRKLEEQLRHAQKMETLGTLVGGIAHDFNNQLTIVLGNLRLALANWPAGASWQCELADAERAGQRCADMTQGLLTFAQRRIGEFRVLDLNPLLAESTRLLRRVLSTTIAIETYADPNLWPVQVDQTQIHQLVMNLAVNARDAMPHGGILTLTTVNQTLDERDCAGNMEWTPGRYVVLTIADTGTGMTADVQARIFEPFFTTKQFGKGTGLGLAMVFGIVKAHGGWVTVSSAPGEGSSFKVYLPAADAPRLEGPDNAQDLIRGGHECILVVDDEELIRKLARAILERWGYRVLTASGGEEALALYQDHGKDIDLVLLDFTMPGMTGLEVMQMLQQINPAVDIVFSSGHTLHSGMDQLLAAGARAFVAKPYSPEVLVGRIRHVLDGSTKKADEMAALMPS